MRTQRQQASRVHVGLLPHEGALQSVELCQMHEAEDCCCLTSYNQQEPTGQHCAALRLIPNTDMVQAYVST